eukprot:gene13158-biopygen12533
MATGACGGWCECRQQPTADHRTPLGPVSKPLTPICTFTHRSSSFSSTTLSGRPRTRRRPRERWGKGGAVGAARGEREGMLRCRRRTWQKKQDNGVHSLDDPFVELWTEAERVGSIPSEISGGSIELQTLSPQPPHAPVAIAAWAWPSMPPQFAALITMGGTLSGHCVGFGTSDGSRDTRNVAAVHPCWQVLSKRGNVSRQLFGGIFGPVPISSTAPK